MNGGLRALGAALPVAARALEASLAECALEEARTLVPVDTGRLRASLTATENAVQTDCEYAACVELGTSRAAAQPYLTPALQAAAAQAAALAREVLF